MHSDVRKELDDGCLGQQPVMGEDFSGAAGENPYAFNRCRLPHALMTKGLNVGCSLCTWCDSHCLLLDVVKDANKGRNQVHSSSRGKLGRSSDGVRTKTVSSSSNSDCPLQSARYDFSLL